MDEGKREFFNIPTEMGLRAGGGVSSAVFESGAKSSEVKPRYDLIPHCALEREAVRMAEGAASHGENNYRKGKDDPAFITDRINHLIDHALRYAAGDNTEDHLAAIRCNTGILMWIEEHREIDERLHAYLSKMACSVCGCSPCVCQ